MRTDRALQSRLNRYYGYAALWSFQIWGPFWTLWLLLFADFFEATLVSANDDAGGSYNQIASEALIGGPAPTKVSARPRSRRIISIRAL